MKGLFGILVRHFHWLILLKAGVDVWSVYNHHNEQVDAKRSVIDSQKIQIKRARKDQELLRSFQENLEASKQRVEEVAQQIEEVQKQLPNSISDTVILDSFMNEANSINIKNVFLTPKAEENRGFYFAKDYQFKGVGTYLQFMIFFERIGNLDRILNVREMNLNVASGKKKGRFQMIEVDTTVEAYRYNAAHKEDRGIKEIEEQFNGPANKQPARKKKRAKRRTKA